MKIAANIHVIPGVTAHPYLLEDPDGLTLIDTGIPGSSFQILRYIRNMGFSGKDLNRILITHADYDHAGSLAALKRATGARVFASLHEARAVSTGRFPRSLHSGNSLLRWVFRLAERFGRIPPAIVDEHLEEGQVLPVMNGLHVMDTRGHTPGHLSFFAPSAGVLFSGDSILSINNYLVGSRGSVTWDQQKADDSVNRQMRLDARIFCAGHGAVLMLGLGGLIKAAEVITRSVS